MPTTLCCANCQVVANRQRNRSRVRERQAPSHKGKLMSDPAVSWQAGCGVEDIDEEDVVQFEHAGKIYAIYHTPSGFYATDGICTHERAYLANGLVIGEIIECP